VNNEPIKIILVDDDENDRLNFIEAFEELKIKTDLQTVNDGAELMEYLTKDDVALSYLLFLDLNMPKKNGLECLSEIRKNDKLKNIIVAIYSTSSSEKDIEATFVSGANVYIEKPNEFEMLKDILEKAVRLASAYKEPPFNRDNFLFRI